jgi:hypothetical protein
MKNGIRLKKISATDRMVTSLLNSCLIRFSEKSAQISFISGTDFPEDVKKMVWAKLSENTWKDSEDPPLPNVDQ